MVKKKEALGEEKKEALGEEKGVEITPYENERQVSIVITYDLDKDKIEIDSGFETSTMIFTDPVDYTAQCLQMALEKWYREKIGLVCPTCGIDHDEDWDYCPKCGYTWLEKIGEDNE